MGAVMGLDLSLQDAEYAAWTSCWKPESPLDKRDAHAHGFGAGYEAGLAAREEPGYDWKSKTTWRLRVCEICGRDAANLALTPSCKHRMVKVVVAPLAAREEPQPNVDHVDAAYVRTALAMLVQSEFTGSSYYAICGKLEDGLAAREDTERPEVPEPPCVLCGTTEELPNGDCKYCAGQTGEERDAALLGLGYRTPFQASFLAHVDQGRDPHHPDLDARVKVGQVQDIRDAAKHVARAREVARTVEAPDGLLANLRFADELLRAVLDVRDTEREHDPRVLVGRIRLCAKELVGDELMDPGDLAMELEDIANDAAEGKFT